MKELKFNKELEAYASAFTSFIIPNIQVNEIILFGSAARGEADENSDIDLFFNIKNKKNEKETKQIIENELEKFYKSKIAEVFLYKGIKNIIKIQVGKLDEWKLKRSIISDGRVLYGNYKELPGKLKRIVLFNIEPIKNIAKRNLVIRRIFGPDFNTAKRKIS